MSDVPAGVERIELLASRVRWLDRYRRAIAIVLAVVLGVGTSHQLGERLGADWPQFHSVLMALFVGVIGWWLIEVALAWLTAVWETEYDRLTRERGLPRAELLSRRPGRPRRPGSRRSPR
jgi:hypothetical protein